MTVETLAFDEFVDLSRVRLGDADAISPNESHSFKTLMSDHAEVTPQQWYQQFDELRVSGSP